jgi:hypothetical protein
MRSLIIIALLFVTSNLQAQFLDFNLFRPRMQIEHSYQFPAADDDINYTALGANISGIFPIKSELKTKKFKLGEPLKLTADQVFGQVEGSYLNHHSDLFKDARSVFGFKAGLAGIHLRTDLSLKKKPKVKITLYSFNVGIAEDYLNYITTSPIVNGLIGRGKIVDLKTLLLYGVYVSYSDKAVFPVPILGINGKLNKKWAYTLIFPVQAKLTFKANKKFKQDLVATFNATQNGHFNDGLIDPEGNRLQMRTTGLQLSLQSRIKLSSNSNLYLEAGWQDAKRIAFTDGYKTLEHYKARNTIFVRASFFITFGKAIFDSGYVDFNI